MLKVRDLAKRWSVSPVTIYNLFNSGELTGLRLSPKNIRFREEDVIEFEKSKWNKEPAVPDDKVTQLIEAMYKQLETPVEELQENETFGNVPVIKLTD